MGEDREEKDALDEIPQQEDQPRTQSGGGGMTALLRLIEASRSTRRAERDSTGHQKQMQQTSHGRITVARPAFRAASSPWWGEVQECVFSLNPPPQPEDRTHLTLAESRRLCRGSLFFIRGTSGEKPGLNGVIEPKVRSSAGGQLRII